MRTFFLIGSLAFTVSCDSKSFSELCESVCEQSVAWRTDCLVALGYTLDDVPSGSMEYFDADDCTSTCKSAADEGAAAGCRTEMRAFLTCADNIDWDGRDCADDTNPCPAEQSSLEACAASSSTGGAVGGHNDCDTAIDCDTADPGKAPDE
jgi:hypothetical protein